MQKARSSQLFPFHETPDAEFVIGVLLHMTDMKPNSMYEMRRTHKSETDQPESVKLNDEFL